MNISNDKKAVIHVARSQVGMDEAAYRLMLERVAGVTSSSDLDEEGFTAVMAEFERLGFRSRKGRAQKTRREGFATAAQVGKIRWLWKAYTGEDNDRALGHWLEKHFHVSHLRFLEDWRAGKAIAILLKMQQHPNAKHPQRRQRREPETA